MDDKEKKEYSESIEEKAKEKPEELSDDALDKVAAGAMDHGYVGDSNKKK